jgi:SAM-dependent methyltransferase
MPQREADQDDPNDLGTALAHLVGTDRRVLVVAAGGSEDAVGLLDLLRARGCRVGQVELGREVRLADVEGAGTGVDVVVLAGALGHVGDPSALLADAMARLRPGGSLVLSTPNVTHGAVRLALLQGRWSPDPTRLHHVSRPSLLALLRESGLRATALHARVGDVAATGPDEPRVPPTVVEWVRDQPDALTTDWLVQAVVDPAAADATDPDVVPLVPERSQRARDRFSDEVPDHEDLRHRLLTLRDHVLGLEEAASAARFRAEVAEAREAAVRRRLDRKNDVLAQLRRRTRRAERQLQEGSAAAPEDRASGLRRVGRRVAGGAGGSGSSS